MNDTTSFGPRTTGRVFVPEDGRRRGVIVVCHERYGLVQHSLDIAQRFANEGYVALTPDFYSDWEGDRDALQRGEVFADVSDDVVARHISATLSYAEAEHKIPSRRAAVMGVCSSASYGLLATKVVPDLRAVLMFYGGVADDDITQDREYPYPELLAAFGGPLLGIWGEADNIYSVPNVRRFRGLLEDAGVSYEFTVFRDMPHGWLNSTMSGRYRPHETELAWNLILSFLERAFSGWFDERRCHWVFGADISRDYDFSKNVRLP